VGKRSGHVILTDRDYALLADAERYRVLNEHGTSRHFAKAGELEALGFGERVPAALRVRTSNRIGALVRAGYLGSNYYRDPIDGHQHRAWYATAKARRALFRRGLIPEPRWREAPSSAYFAHHVTVQAIMEQLAPDGDWLTEWEIEAPRLVLSDGKAIRPDAAMDGGATWMEWDAGYNYKTVVDKLRGWSEQARSDRLIYVCASDVLAERAKRLAARACSFTSAQKRGLYILSLIEAVSDPTSWKSWAETQAA